MNLPSDPIPSTDNNTINIPPGSFAAELDSKVDTTNIRIGEELFVIPTVEQTQPGNCAEYSALDTALMALSLNFGIGEELQIYLERHTPLEQAKNRLEAGYVLQILEHLHQQNRPCGFSVNQNDRNDVEEKKANIYLPLGGINSALVFWAMLNGVNSQCPVENFHLDYSPKLESRIRMTPNLAIYFMDRARVHATAIFKYNGYYFSIDSFRPNNVIQFENENRVLEKIKGLLYKKEGQILLSDLQR